jgi:hypothetical protein
MSEYSSSARYNIERVRRAAHARELRGPTPQTVSTASAWGDEFQPEDATQKALAHAKEMEKLKLKDIEAVLVQQALATAGALQSDGIHHPLLKEIAEDKTRLLVRSRRIVELTQEVRNAQDHLNSGIVRLSGQDQFLSLMREGPKETQDKVAELAEETADSKKEADKLREKVKIARELSEFWDGVLAKMGDELVAKGKGRDVPWLRQATLAYKEPIRAIGDDETAT